MKLSKLIFGVITLGLMFSLSSTLTFGGDAEDLNRMQQLVDNRYTDKDRGGYILQVKGHSYLPIYEKLFGDKDVKNILEIGVFQGGSIKLWHDYFQQANVYGIDTRDDIKADIKDKDRIKLFIGDAYKQSSIDKYFNGVKFDVIIDDGPHTLTSWKKMIKLYLPLLSKDGVLIIEDLKTIRASEILRTVVPNNDKKNVKIFDLRSNKDVRDDMLFVIDRSGKGKNQQ